MALDIPSPQQILEIVQCEEQTDEILVPQDDGDMRSKSEEPIIVEFEYLKNPVNLSSSIYHLAPQSQSKFGDVPVEWKSPHSYNDLAFKLKASKSTFNRAVKFFGLEKSEWYSILKHLNYEDWKSCRVVCNRLNEFISTWSNFAEKTRLVFDGRTKVGVGSTAKLSSLITEPNFVPLFQEVRLQNAKPSTGRLWLGRTLTSLSTLEMKNCILNWFDFVEILSLFPTLTSLSIILDKNVKGEPLNYFSLFMYGLRFDNEKKLEFKLEESPKFPLVHMDPYKTGLANLKFLSLDVMYLGLTNSIIKFISLSNCSKIEEFRVTLNKNIFLDIPPEIHAGKIRKSVLDTKDFMQNNRNTMKKLFLKFEAPEDTKSKLCEISEMIKNCVVHLGAFQDLFTSRSSPVNLDEFSLHLGIFSIYGEKIKEILQSTFESLHSFVGSQVNLKKLTINEWCWPNAEKNVSALHSLIPKDCAADVGLFVLAGFEPPFCPNWRDFEELLTSIKIQWELCNIRRFNQIMPEDSPIMSKVTNFELLNNLPICFINFDVHIMVSKFPNLTRLHLQDMNPPYLTGKPCANGHRIEPAQFQDKDLQLIFQHLLQLEVIFMKTRMYPITDFAFTGINPKEFRRMEKEKSSNCDPNAVIGFQLRNLERLTSLSMIGLSYKVTDITAFTAFKGEFPRLKTLHFVTSGFSSRARKFLRAKFKGRPGFKLTVSHPPHESLAAFGNLKKYRIKNNKTDPAN